MASERSGVELERLLLTLRPAWGLERLRETGVLASVAPELLEMVGVEQNEFHAFAVWEHALLALGDLLQLRRADRLASGKREGDLSAETVSLVHRTESVLAADAALKVADLAVDGRDVTAMFGQPPGPYVGRVLAQLLDEVTDEPSRNRREYLLERLAELSKL